MNQRNQKSTNSLVPVRAVREGSPYRVPRHPAPLDLMLDGNEGLPPSVELWKDLAEQGSDVLFRYPNTGELEQTLTQRLGLKEGQLLVTAGSDDGIDRICRAMLSEGRARLTAEIAELEARAEADQAAAASRVGDELRTEISRLAAEVSDRLLADTLDDSAQQALIENFIQKVGSSS